MSQKRPRGPDADVVRFDPEFDRLAGDWINTAPGLVAIEAARPFEVPSPGMYATRPLPRAIPNFSRPTA
ncbi:hypothetical protein ACWGQL_34785 [Streptomyces lydicus]